MMGRQPRYSKDEHARRGTEIYEQQGRPPLWPARRGEGDMITGVVLKR
jgi:hypothetical protein